MLDQQTDRMWYVIGAVLVGAAIVFLLNSSVPELFAAVGETFGLKTEEVVKDVAAIGPEKTRPNLINASTMTHGYLVDHYNGELTDDHGGVFYSTTDFIPVEAGQEYELFVPEDKWLLGVQFAFYIDDKTHLDGWVIGDVQSERFVVPEWISYIRITSIDASTGIIDSDENETGEYDQASHYTQWRLERVE